MSWYLIAIKELVGRVCSNISDFEKGNIPSFLATTKPEIEEEHRVLLVMLSRARHGIIVTRAKSLISKKGNLSDAESPWAALSSDRPARGEPVGGIVLGGSRRSGFASADAGDGFTHTCTAELISKTARES